MPAKGNPGDKLFHHVDYSPGFHEGGELVVGSSFYRPGRSVRTNPVPPWCTPESQGCWWRLCPRQNPRNESQAWLYPRSRHCQCSAASFWLYPLSMLVVLRKFWRSSRPSP